MFLAAHLGFAVAPATAAAGWWGQNHGFKKILDLRWLIVGTLLPDVIDKAVGQVLFKPYFESGRIFAHTLAFTLALFVAGAWEWRRRGDGRVLLLATGVASHLVLDRIWAEPVTALWPALGPFVRHPSSGGIMEQIRAYLGDPAFWATELAGAALLLASLRGLGVRNASALKEFFAHGRAPALEQFALTP